MILYNIQMNITVIIFFRLLFALSQTPRRRQVVMTYVQICLLLSSRMKSLRCGRWGRRQTTQIRLRFLAVCLLDLEARPVPSRSLDIVVVNYGTISLQAVQGGFSLDDYYASGRWMRCQRSVRCWIWMIVPMMSAERRVTTDAPPRCSAYELPWKSKKTYVKK
jgi:hypothetical protein